MSESTHRVYFGTYTRKSSEGVYVAEFDSETGTLITPRLAAKAESPSFVAMHPTGQFAFAVGESGQFQGQESGAVCAYHVEPRTGELALVNAVASGGKGPCFVEAHRDGKAVFVANYSGGSVASFAVRDDGSLSDAVTVIQHEGSGPDTKRQQRPHAHSIRVDPSGAFVLAADLGADRVFIYRIDPQTAAMTPHDPPFDTLPPGAGPRHLAWHPNGRWLYVVNELDCTVSRFVWDASRGTLQLTESVPTVPEDYDGRKYCAEIVAHASGRFVYASTRGHDTIAVFAVDASDGRLTFVTRVATGGEEPRHFALDPTDRWLLAANQNSDSVVVFRVDESTGVPREMGVRETVSMPVCVRFA